MELRAEHAAYNIRFNTRETETPIMRITRRISTRILERYASILAGWYNASHTNFPLPRPGMMLPSIAKHPTMDNAVSRLRWPQYTSNGTSMGVRPDFP
jgi:hypothetical protein